MYLISIILLIVFLSNVEEEYKMEMKLKENEFWILHEGDTKLIYDVESEAINRVKKGLNGSNEIELWKVYFDDDKIKVEQVPWKDIAIAMSRGK